ncbi:MAG: hypothetical protein IPI58_06480 [Alphaproteobacteria bacterium]|nr:MAG: hypothetical protein IPI58_06480 [Alphaproteobacteria bacterium]
MLYELTAQNIRDGKLSEEEFSSGLRYRVPIFDLRSFPHSEELLKAGKLSPEQIKVRAGAIYKAMRERGLIHNGSNFSIQSSRVFVYEDAEIVANRSASVLQNRHVETNFLDANGPPLARHYWLIKHHGFTDAHNQEYMWIDIGDDDIGRAGKNVFPGVWNEKIPVTSYRLKVAAFALLDRDTSPKNYWANLSRMAPELLEEFPTDNTCFLVGQLHEKRHLHQIGIESPSVIAGYYAEMDADMAAIASLQKAGIGEEAVLAKQHSRYMGMLFTLPQYWFAPAMQDLWAKKEPENFYKALGAVYEVKVRLGESLLGQAPRSLNSEGLQHDIKIWDQESNQGRPLSEQSALIHSFFCQACDSVSSVRGKNPAPIFSAVHKLLDQGVFTDPFTQRVAQGIVDAARYFNPDLIKADNAPSRARLEDRLRSSPKLTNG